MPGSIGATDAARVFKGTRMGGHMGDEQVTVKNLEIVEINKESGELLIKGAVPGARGGLLMISTKEGNIEIAKEEEKVEAEKVEEKKEEVVEEKVEVTEEVKEDEKTEEAKEEKVEEKKEVKEETPEDK